MKFLATCWIIAVMLAGPAVHAGGCRNVAVRHNNVVVVKEVVKVVEAVVTPIIARFVEIPTYNAIYPGGGYQYPGYAPPAPAYAPPYQPQAVAPCDKHAAKIDRILALAEDHDARIRALEGGTPAQAKPPLRLNPMEKAEDGLQGAAPQAPAGGDRLVVLMTKNCASCHDQGRAASAGKGFVLTVGGKMAPLNEQQLGLLISEVTSGHMPKGGKMSADERLEFVNLIVNGPVPAK